MWLLKTSRAELEWFNHRPERYAILSHVWEEDPYEQSFQQIRDIMEECAESGKNPVYYVSFKIRRCCQWAAAHGFAYLWIDTCCINKDSSAELSEAINSMFVWYAEATVCYAYLYDVTDDDHPSAFQSSFRKSKWFTRGWTLQELIAPKVVIFLSQTWVPIASKRSISPLLEEITGIEAGVLMGTISLSEVSVARRRMSWASERHTRRVEDEAYCLMGIFDVHLPTIYGEGREAFIRLQEEIMRRIPDATLLAWGPRGEPVETTVGYRSVFPTPGATRYIERSCLLAPRPAEFAGCADLTNIPKKALSTAFDLPHNTPRFTVSSHGIQAYCPIVNFSNWCKLLLLPCCLARNDSEAMPMFVALLLRFQGEDGPAELCVGTRTVVEEVVPIPDDIHPDGTIPANGLQEPWRRPITRTQRNSMRDIREHYIDVRCVLLPMGFDFSTCLQRPLRRIEPPLTPSWESSYIAYRPRHVLRRNPEKRFTLLGLKRQPSHSPTYKLFFPSWVSSRLEVHGLRIPLLAFNPAPELGLGSCLIVTLVDRLERPAIHIDLRTDISPPKISGVYRDLAALWCEVRSPGEPSRSLVAQVSALRGESDASESSTEDSESITSADNYSMLSEFELQDGFVDLWERGGCRGCREFSVGRWRIIVKLTRLCETGSDQDSDTTLCNVYVVDVELLGYTFLPSRWTPTPKLEADTKATGRRRR
ncbi:HET-domain-containing protein [Trametes meyenii]|nr:HET-domain-containing protein [Trametes meyenii]